MREIIIPIGDNEVTRRIERVYGINGELIRCKDCKHRPRRIDESEYRFNLEFPDYRCPCRCEDDWYSWMPDDDWYCGNGERKEE